LDAGRALAVEQHAARLGVHDGLQVRPFAGRRQIGTRRAGAEAPAPGHLYVADAAGMAAVDVVAALESDLGAGFDQRLAQHGTLDLPRHPQRPTAAAHRVLAADPRFRALEVLQDVVIGPTAIAELGPVVEVLGLAAHVGEAVDRARAAEPAA